MKKLLILLHLLAALVTNAQTRIEWEKSYGGSGSDELRDVLPLPDGGYLWVGNSWSDDGDIVDPHGERDFWVLRTDPVGQIIWKKNYGGSGVEIPSNALSLPGGGFVILGLTGSIDGDISEPVSGNGSLDFWMIKIDDNGNLVWDKNYGGTDGDQGLHLAPTSDGGFVVSGTTYSNDEDLTGNYGDQDGWVFKTDLAGNIIWQKNFGGSGNDVAQKVIQTADGGFMFNGFTYSSDFDIAVNKGQADCWIVRLDANGDLLWSKTYGGDLFDAASNIRENPDGSFVVMANSYSANGDVGGNNGDRDVWIFKIDAAGVLLWEKHYGDIGTDLGLDMIQLPDGNYIISGQTQSDEQGFTETYQAFIMKIDPSGNLISMNRYGSPGNDRGYVIRNSLDGGLIMGAMSDSSGIDVSANQGARDYWLVKLRLVTALVTGNIVLDHDENCISDPGDTTMANIIVYATDEVSGDVTWSLSNGAGRYFLETDSVNQLVTCVLPSPYYTFSACSSETQLAELSSSTLSDSIDFYLHPIVDCPYPEVDIAAGLLRRCSTAVYQIQYCNNGTAPAEDAWLTVTFDRTLTVINSEIPWTNVSSNTYTFPLGDLDVFECADFAITVQVSCDSTYIGQTACASVHIYPDSLCLPVSGWNGVELRATAVCIGTDSVQLTLQNIGATDMQEATEFLVIEDIIMKDGGNILLNSMESATWTIPVNGLSQRIIAHQPEDHPYKTFTTAAVNLCKTEDLPPVPGPISDFMTVFPEDEESPFEAVDCQPIIGAYDPNDKTVQPTGRGIEGYIMPNTDLTYKIRFQNTGSDTAFTVTLVDTISPNLDLTSLKAGASSHPFRMELSGDRVLKFVFENIMLPDSNVNEPGSHGFVQFSMRQAQDNQQGVEIHNNAGIFFDFNPAIITNTVLNTIGEMYVMETISTAAPDGKDLPLRVSPNPATDHITFSLPDSVQGFDLLLYDVSGRVIQKAVSTGSSLQLYRNNLPEGLYWFEVRVGEEQVVSGKLMLR